MLKTSWKWTKRVTLGTTFVCTGLTAYAYKTDEGIARTLKFSAYVTPMTIAYTRAAYKKYDSVEQKEQRMKELHKTYAPELLNIILRMRGYYVKGAQMCVGAGLLPDAYEDSFKVLLDKVPPRDYDIIKKIVEDELGKPIEEVFKTFDQTALAAASIGQVHRATLHNGKKVCVKVQYPEVEKFFDYDVEAVKLSCKLCGLGENLDKLMEEVTKSFVSEFDYREEATNMRVCSDNMKVFKDIYIPEPVDKDHKSCPKGLSLCTRKVLTMDAVQGEPIKKRMDKVMKEEAQRQGKTVKQLTEEYEQMFKDPKKVQEFMNSPPPSSLLVSLGLAYLSSRDLIRNTVAFSYNYTLGLGGILGAPIEYKFSTQPVNGPSITKLLYEAHGHQVFQDGCFNADPHAGNVMVCDDGRLGLIDYGNAPVLTLKQRVAMAHFILALDSNDDEQIIQAFEKIGAKSKKNSKQFLLLSALCDFDQQFSNPEVLKKLGFEADTPIEEMYVEAYKKDEWIDFPSDLINLQRCLMTLNGVASLTGGGNPRPSKMWKKAAQTLIDQNYSEEFITQYDKNPKKSPLVREKEKKKCPFGFKSKPKKEGEPEKALPFGHPKI